MSRRAASSPPASKRARFAPPRSPPLPPSPFWVYFPFGLHREPRGGGFGPGAPEPPRAGVRAPWHGGNEPERCPLGLTGTAQERAEGLRPVSRCDRLVGHAGECAP